MARSLDDLPQAVSNPKGTYLVQLNHVGMSYDLQNVDFPRDAINVRLVLYLLFLENFDRHLFVGD